MKWIPLNITGTHWQLEAKQPNGRAVVVGKVELTSAPFIHYVWRTATGGLSFHYRSLRHGAEFLELKARTERHT